MRKINKRNDRINIIKLLIGVMIAVMNVLVYMETNIITTWMQVLAGVGFILLADGMHYFDTKTGMRFLGD